MNLLNNEKLTIARIAPLIRKKQISPVELTEFSLERIHRLQPKLNAFITVTAELARKQARQAEKEILRGKYRGPLHGIPISLKDLFFTAGIRTTAGSKILRNFVPVENAVVVDRLLEAGAVLLGKTNLHEFAYGVTTNNPHYGPVHNPWSLQRVSGGSSGGECGSGDRLPGNRHGWIDPHPFGSLRGGRVETQPGPCLPRRGHPPGLQPGSCGADLPVRGGRGFDAGSDCVAGRP